MIQLPLEGIRIIAMTTAWAGPFTAQLLADWGAEVIKVESRRASYRGYRASGMRVEGSIKGRLMSALPNREASQRPWNCIPMVNAHARNKLSMTVDLMYPEGVGVFKRLVKVSDVVIDNMGPGTLDKLGIDYEALKEVKPDIIMISMPAFGVGPYKDSRTFGSQLDQFAGQGFFMGYRDSDATVISGTVHADATSGAIAAFAALMALHYRSRTGKGRLVEVAQVETLLPQFGEFIMEWTMNQGIARNLGNRDTSAIQGCYRCQGDDRWVNITITSDEEWEAFCKVLGNPSWTRDERFSDAISRYKNHDELDGFIAKWTSQQDNYEVMRILQKEGIPAGPVMNERDCYSDPHLRKRGFFQELTQADCGTHLYPGLAWRMSKAPNKIRRPPCLLGEHNDYIYKQIIGVSDEEYAELEKAGHIGLDYVDDV